MKIFGFIDKQERGNSERKALQAVETHWGASAECRETNNKEEDERDLGKERAPKRGEHVAR